MRRYGLAIALALVGLMGAASHALGQTIGDVAGGMWANVEAVSPGDLLEVRLKDGKKLRGRLSGVSDTGLTLSRGRQTLDFEREQVSQVYHLVPKRSKMYTLIGALVGFGAFAAGHAALLPEEPAPTHAADAILIPASIGVGAMVGNAIGRRARKRVLLYDARVLKTLSTPAIPRKPVTHAVRYLPPVEAAIRRDRAAGGD